MNTTAKKNSSTKFVDYLLNKKYAHMTLLGFSAGLPLYLIFSSLSLWLGEVGVVKSSITMFSWAALGYSFKFLWAPLIDKVPLVFFTKLLGQRRGWLIFTQFVVMLSIIWMASIDPAKDDHYLTLMAFAAVLLGFSSATQDIVIDAWRIEASNKEDIAILSSLYIVGYRVGMITSSAGALYIAYFFGTSVDNYNYHAWQMSYFIMALFMLIGIVTTLFIKEPFVKKNDENYQTKDYMVILLIFVVAVISFIVIYQYTGNYVGEIKLSLQELTGNKMIVGIIISTFQLILSFAIAIAISTLIYKAPRTNREMIKSIYIAPVLDLFMRNKGHIWLLLGIICTYRISDIVMGVSANLFYQYMGFNLGEIAGIVKTFGLIMTLTGGLLGGVLVIRFGVMRIMVIGAILSSITNLLFMVMAETGQSIGFLIVLISSDNLSAGLALAAFIGFLSMMVNKSFTAVQYAMFSSVMTLFPKILGGFSGGFVDSWGFSTFFTMTAIIGIPVVVLLIIAERRKCFI